MFLVAGLGNPGDKYKNTRHNIGFMVIDEMTKNLSSSTKISKPNFKAQVLKQDDTIYVKPQTYMNLSGESLQATKEYFKVELANIIVIHDDLDLPFGSIKFKVSGGHGGHNGLRSIDSHISQNYIRIRIGIGKPEDKSQVANYVLDNFTKEESNKLNDIISHAISAVWALKTVPLDIVKSKFTI